MSRLEDLIARQMVRLDTGHKRLLDAVKVVARNVFYRALAPFKAAYDNYRDNHEHFRRLTQSAGVLRWNGRKLEVHLLPATPARVGGIAPCSPCSPFNQRVLRSELEPGVETWLAWVSRRKYSWSSR